MQKVLLLASSNPGKLSELRALLAGLPIRLAVPEELLDEPLAIRELGESYAENASHKARAYARASGVWALADDSGLEVDALGGAPGLRSARLVEAGGDDRSRRQRLLELLAIHPRPWRASFRCSLALADPHGRVDLAEGSCSGEIIPQERGAQGFGYDPIFLIQSVKRTMAELSLEEKNRLSHRAHAAGALLPTLRDRLGVGRGSD